MNAVNAMIYHCNTCNFDLQSLPRSSIPLTFIPSIFLEEFSSVMHVGRTFPFHCSLCQTDICSSNSITQITSHSLVHILRTFSTVTSVRSLVRIHCSQCIFDVQMTCKNLTSQTNTNPNLPQPRNPNLPQPEWLRASRSINVSSSPMNSTISTLRNYLPTAILRRPAGPSRPPMFSQMPVPGQSVATGYGHLLLEPSSVRDSLRVLHSLRGQPQELPIINHINYKFKFSK